MFGGVWDIEGGGMSIWGILLPPFNVPGNYTEFPLTIAGSNGANLSFPKYFAIGTHSTRDSFLVGLINAAPYIGSAFIGCWVSDPLNNYFGRRGTIFVTGNFCLWAVLGSAFTRTWQQLLVCRILLGIGMGAKARSAYFTLSLWFLV